VTAPIKIRIDTWRCRPSFKVFGPKFFPPIIDFFLSCLNFLSERLPCLENCIYCRLWMAENDYESAFENFISQLRPIACDTVWSSAFLSRHVGLLLLQLPLKVSLLLDVSPCSLRDRGPHFRNTRNFQLLRMPNLQASSIRFCVSSRLHSVIFQKTNYHSRHLENLKRHGFLRDSRNIITCNIP
jgi:hypothetical protein